MYCSLSWRQPLTLKISPKLRSYVLYEGLVPKFPPCREKLVLKYENQLNVFVILGFVYMHVVFQEHRGWNIHMQPSIRRIRALNITLVLIVTNHYILLQYRSLLILFFHILSTNPNPNCNYNLQCQSPSLFFCSVNFWNFQMAVRH